MLERIVAEYQKRFDDMAKAITEEMGAPAWLAQRAQAAIGIGHLSTAIEVLKTVEDPALRAIMIVAHNPGLEDLVTRLTGEHVELPTAALVNVELPIRRWSDLDLSAGASMIDLWRPADL